MSSASTGGASPSDRATAAGGSLELAWSGSSLSDAPQAKLPAPRDEFDRDSAETFGEDDGHRQDQHAQDAGGLESQRGKRNKPVKWSAEEDRRLREAVTRFSEARWKDIARMVKTRNHVQCLQRWKKVLKPGLVKGQWGGEEDDRLVSLVERGFRNWGQVASFMDGRTSKQCRERWCHHLDPAVRKGGYTTEEDDLIIFLQGEVGNRWADIAKRLTGRTENAVKIRWKALNRRQRDARNKAAQAAAVASTTEAASPPPEPQKPKPAPKTGAREGTRVQVRAANRVSSSSSSFTSGNASLRGTATPRTGTGAVELAASRGGSASRCESPASFRLRSPQTRDAPKPPAPAHVAARLPAPAANGSAGEQPPSGPGVPPRISIAGEGDNHPWMPLSADRSGRDRDTEHAPRTDTAFAADVGLSEAAGATGAETAASWSDMKPAIMSAAAGAGTTEHFTARDPPGRSSQALVGPAGSGGGGLHRLCAALRNVEAMDSLQVSGDDAMVNAAASATAERFRLRSSAGGGRHGAGGPSPFLAKSDAEGGRAAHFSGGGGDVEIGRDHDRDRSRPEERSGSSAVSLSPPPPPRRRPFPPASVEDPERETRPSVAPSNTAAQPAACVPAREMRPASASATATAITAPGVIHPRRLSSPTLAGTAKPMVFSPAVSAKADTATGRNRSSQTREKRPQPLPPRLQSGPPRPCYRSSPDVVATVEAAKVTEELPVMRSAGAIPALAATSVGPSPRSAAGHFLGGNSGRGPPAAATAAASAPEGGGCRKLSAVVEHGAAPATVGHSKRARQAAEEEDGGVVDAAPGGGPFKLVRDRLHKRARSPPVTPLPMAVTVAVTSPAAVDGADVVAGSNSTSRGVGIHVNPAACVAVPAAE